MWNKEQQEAIETIDGAVQVIAAAGSGKTSVLTERVNRMVAMGIEESEILVVSFTNASAEDLKKKLLDDYLLEDVQIGTFHSICKKILEDVGYIDLLNQPNKYQLKREIEKETGIKNLNIDDVLSFISYQKSHLRGYKDEFAEKGSAYENEELRACYKVYEEYKQKNDCYDFDDWLLLTLQGYKQKKITKTWNYLLIDEYQDSNEIQHKLARVWCPSNNIFVVGDINQSLYEWNGAAPELFANFYKTIPDTKVINMNINYRSSSSIVERANNFIREYGMKYGNYKDSCANEANEGHIESHIYRDYMEEASAVLEKIKELQAGGVNLNDIAVIYRNNSNADVMESLLKTEKIEYTLVSNQSFFDKKEVKGIISILRLVNSFEDDEAFENIFTEFRCHPLQFFKKDLVDELILESGKRNCSLYEALLDHKFEKDWQSRNRNTFIDCINRLRMQHEQNVEIPKMINNIVKMFKIEDYIRDRYDYQSWDDKFESINNLKLIANSTLDALLKLAATGRPKKRKKKGVTLSTIHKSKGLEWKYVFVISLEDEKFPCERSGIDEESHIMYVGVTRPKEWLWVSSIGESRFYNEYVASN